MLKYMRILSIATLLFIGCSSNKTTYVEDSYIEIPSPSLQESSFGDEVYVWESFNKSTNKAVIIQ